MAAEKSFELPLISSFQTLPSTPNPTPNDAIPNPPPPLYQLFSENRRQLAVYGCAPLPDDDENKLMRSSVPLGPFTGYALILKRSCFLKPAQQLLEDLCGSGFRVMKDPSTDDLKLWGQHRVGPRQFNDSRLVFMLEEVYNRCKLYCQQLQSVVTSFEAVAGLRNAAPFVSSAIRAISNHFGYLKNAILDQLHFTGKTGTLPTTTSNLADHTSHFVKDHEVPWLFVAPKTSSGQNQVHNFSNLRNSVWRSQRGLPEHAVAVLKKWMFEHFLHPYPTDSEKHMLAQQTGLSRAQISNWFINSRVRLWKPMVEEIHVLQTQKSTQKVLPPETTLINQNHKISSKRSRHSEDNRLGSSSASLALNLPQNIGRSSEAAFKNWF